MIEVEKLLLEVVPSPLHVKKYVWVCARVCNKISNITKDESYFLDSQINKAHFIVTWLHVGFWTHSEAEHHVNCHTWRWNKSTVLIADTKRENIREPRSMHSAQRHIPNELNQSLTWSRPNLIIFTVSQWCHLIMNRNKD